MQNLSVYVFFFFVHCVGQKINFSGLWCKMRRKKFLVWLQTWQHDLQNKARSWSELWNWIVLAGIFLWTFRILWWDRPGVSSHYRSQTHTECSHCNPCSPSLSLVLTCIVHQESLKCWIESSQNWEPQTTKCCSSVRWPHSWQSWRTTLPIVASSICVWMVRQLSFPGYYVP